MSTAHFYPTVDCRVGITKIQSSVLTIVEFCTRSSSHIQPSSRSELFRDAAEIMCDLTKDINYCMPQQCTWPAKDIKASWTLIAKRTHVSIMLAPRSAAFRDDMGPPVTLHPRLLHK